MKISNRLKLIASFVDDNANVIDVGCDHALLDIFLVQNKTDIKTIASDINEGPLEGARKNIKRYHLEDKIEVKLGDGISTINNQTDTIIISGLGGETIVDILKKDLNKLPNIKTLILSPHGDSYIVRKEITALGFKISNEIFIYDQNKPYIIIKFVRGKEEYTDDELFFGPYILQEKNSFFRKYYQELNIKNKKVLTTIPSTNTAIRQKLEKEIERLDRILKV